MCQQRPRFISINPLVDDVTGGNRQPYDEVDWDLNYRDNQDEYVIGSGEFGVLKYEPYKSEILPHWEYKDESAAERGGDAIYDMFLDYLDDGDFPGADMARKFLQMGFTRAMRYAKYPGGKKYDQHGDVRDPVTPDEPDCETWADPDKRRAAVVYKEYWDHCRNNSRYQHMKEAHRNDVPEQQTFETVEAD